MHYAELNQTWSELTGPGAPFEIDEYDGSESVHVIGGHDYLTA